MLPGWMLGAFAAEHELIALRIFAHREVGWFAIFPLGFAVAFAAGRDDLRRALDDVGDLKSDAGPGLLALAAAMDGDGAPCDGDFGDVRVLAGDLRAETTGVKCGGAPGICGPNGVFQCFDSHAECGFETVEAGQRITMDFFAGCLWSDTFGSCLLCSQKMLQLDSIREV